VTEEDFQQRLAALCADAFDNDTAAAVLFMIRRHPELQNKSPGSAAVTESGALAVEKILKKGLHGLPA